MEECPTGILVDLNEEKRKEKSTFCDQPEATLPPLTFDVGPSPPPSPQRNIISIDDLLNQDVKLIDTEEFNFDLLMSPQVEDDDADDAEIFFGPVQGFSEICAAASAKAKSESDNVQPLSPLNPRQVAELFKEAHELAFYIENLTRDSPDTKMNNLARKFSNTSIDTGQQTTIKKINSPPYKSPSADSGLADTSASSHEDRSEGPPRFTLDYKTPDKVDQRGCKEAGNLKLPKSDIMSKSNTGAKLRGRREGLENLKCTKVTRTGLRVPTEAIPKSGLLPKPGSRLVRGGSFRERPVTAPQKRQRKNSLGSDVEMPSIASDNGDSSSSITGVPMVGKRALGVPRQQPSNCSRQTGLRVPQPRTRTLSNTSTGSTCSTSSQLSNCSQASAASLTSLRVPPRTKMQLKPTTTSGMKMPAKTQERKATTGPMRAKPPSPTKPKTTRAATSLKFGVKEKENQPSAMKPPDARAPRRSAVSSTSSGGSVGSTPTPQKPEKSLQPKRLLSSAGGGACTPKKNIFPSGQPSTPKSAVTNSATRLRSLLPTPSSSKSAAVKPSPLLARFNNSSVTSRDQDGSSPVFTSGRRTSNIGRGSGLTTPDVTKKLFPL